MRVMQFRYKSIVMLHYMLHIHNWHLFLNYSFMFTNKGSYQFIVPRASGKSILLSNNWQPVLVTQYSAIYNAIDEYYDKPRATLRVRTSKHQTFKARQGKWGEMGSSCYLTPANTPIRETLSTVSQVLILLYSAKRRKATVCVYPWC